MQGYGYQNVYPQGYMYQTYNNPYNQMVNNVPYTTNNDLSIQYCDSIDYVKSQNIRMDGQPNYYAKTDGTEIYCKKLNPLNGSSITETYVKMVEPNEQETVKDNTQEIFTTLISDLRKELSDELAEIKNLVLDNLTYPNGGIG